MPEKLSDLEGECCSFVLRVSRSRDDGKFDVDAELHDENGCVLETCSVTQRRPLAFAMEALVNAAHTLEIATSRGRVKLVTK